MLSIGVIGTGYVGLVHAVVMADFGNHVIAMDIDKEKIENLKEGIVPIYEPGLEEFLKRNIKEERIHFTTSMEEVVRNSDVVFIAVGTPPKEDGSADLRYIVDVVEKIGDCLSKDIIIVNKSTVPIGTGHLVQNILKEKNQNRFDIQIVSNPEFLREGKAIEDILSPSRIVIGATSKIAIDTMRKLYVRYEEEKIPFVITSIETAEMIKYASNAFLAVKISYINEMANLAEKVGADINQIALAMGLDKRISPEFLKAGAGYGGSCFPKDTKAIAEIAKDYKETLLVVNAAIEANEKQNRKMVEKIVQNQSAMTIGIWGLSFKPDTDDMREAPSVSIINKLVHLGNEMKVYCPGGMKEARWRLADCKEHIQFCESIYEAAEQVDALVIVTEWDEFREANMEEVKKRMRGEYLFDLRNIFYKNNRVIQLFQYYGVGV